MIKKLLFIFVLGLAVNEIFAQANCTPNLTCLASGATEGICPDSATGLPAGSQGLSYSTNISIRIPTSTTSGGSTYTLSHLGITAVLVDDGTGTYVALSTIGLDYLGSGSNSPSGASAPSGVTMTKFCYWNSGIDACAILSGTPTVAGTFPVRIKSKVRVTVFGIGTWQDAPDNNQYKIVISPAVGVSLVLENDFNLYPNPSSSELNLTFNIEGNKQIRISDLLGRVVKSSSSNSATDNINVSELSKGMYNVEVIGNDKKVIKKLIIE